MDNLMYYEEEEMIQYAEYEKLKEKVDVQVGNNSREMDDMRMQSFYNKSVLSNKNKSMFYLELNKVTGKLQFVKKAKRNHITYEVSLGVTEEECKKLLSQETGWMRKQHNPLLSEFAWLCEMGNIELDSLSEYKREQYKLDYQSSLLFVHNLKCAKNSEQQFFDHNAQTLDCLNCDQVILKIRKDIAFPVLLRQSIPISC